MAVLTTRFAIALALLGVGCGGPSSATDAGDARNAADSIDSTVQAGDAGDAMRSDVPSEAAGCTTCGSACVNLQSDAHNCGACGHDCTTLPGVLPGAIECVAGACAVSAACISGRAHCSSDPNTGCETDITLPAHCGSCATVCGASAPLCAASASGAYSCATGCGSSAMVVCSGTCSDPMTDPLNCGGCGHVCPMASSGTRACVSGVCGVTCPPGTHGCSGACVDNLALATCGFGCTPCSTVHATPTCNGLACALSCSPGFADCDGEASTGCETDLGRSPNCGACGNVCPSGEGCTGSPSACATCPAGTTLCEGACVSLASSTTDCGSCGNACGATFACVGGTCACAAGTTLCGSACTNVMTDGSNCGACGFACAPHTMCAAGVCAVPAPRQIAPLSTATVTSHRPTFHWALASGTDGAQVDICRDRACTMLVTTFSATGASGAATSALAAGLYYWRVHGSVLGTVGANTSPVWEFRVGVISAPVDTSWGTSLDVNGDGFSDVVIGAPDVNTNTGRVYIYLGSAAGVAATPATTLTGPDGMGGYFGFSVASAGDVNGDGFADAVVGAYGVSGNTGRAYVYLGSASGLATTPATTLTGPDGAGGYFAHSVASAGDVNGDGFADVVVGAYGASTAVGRTYLYFGSATGLAATPAITLGGPDGANANFGWSVASAGDVNGDGFADVVVGAPNATVGAWTNAGCVHVYLGSAAGLATTPATTLTGTGTITVLGDTVASAGDVNGDGFADVVVGRAGTSNYYLGSATGLATTPGTMPAALGYHRAAGAGDVNGDGFADVVVGVVGFYGAGDAYLYLGSASGLATAPAATLAGGVGTYFGQSVSSTGDVNNDGFADVIIGAPTTNTTLGRASVSLGGSAGLGTATALVGPDGGEFGTSVASAARVPARHDATPLCRVASLCVAVANVATGGARL